MKHFLMKSLFITDCRNVTNNVVNDVLNLSNSAVCLFSRSKKTNEREEGNIPVETTADRAQNGRYSIK